MRWKGWRILAVVWWAVWFLVFVPVHRRGMVPLRVTDGGGARALVSIASCCCSDEKPVGTSGQGDRNKPGSSSENCAICYLVTTLAATPVSPAPLVMLEWRRFERPARAIMETTQGCVGETGCRDPPCV
jgi:hypothetical protein